MELSERSERRMEYYPIISNESYQQLDSNYVMNAYSGYQTDSANSSRLHQPTEYMHHMGSSHLPPGSMYGRSYQPIEYRSQYNMGRKLQPALIDSMRSQHEPMQPHTMNEDFSMRSKQNQELPISQVNGSSHLPAESGFMYGHSYQPIEYRTQYNMGPKLQPALIDSMRSQHEPMQPHTMNEDFFMRSKQNQELPISQVNGSSHLPAESGFMYGRSYQPIEYRTQYNMGPKLQPALNDSMRSQHEPMQPHTMNEDFFMRSKQNQELPISQVNGSSHLPAESGFMYGHSYQPIEYRTQYNMGPKLQPALIDSMRSQHEPMQPHTMNEDFSVGNKQNKNELSETQLKSLLEYADVYDMDSNLDSMLSSGLELSRSTSRSSQSPLSKEIRCPAIKVNENYVEVGTFDVTPSELEKIYSNGKFCNGFNNYFIGKLNKDFRDIPCVLISNGPYPRKYGLWTLRYSCKHELCLRSYKVFQICRTHFKVFRNNEDIKHDVDNPICRPINGQKRAEAQDKLKKMLPDKYLAECESSADKELLSKGNLQDIISLDATKKMRSDAIAANDFHKDEIIDLLLMKVTESDSKEKSNGQTEAESSLESVIYLRRICLDPFIVTMFTDDQFNCLKLLCKDGTPITIYFDATGGVVKHAGKVIYYYAGVTRDFSIPLKKHEKRRILPLFESINGAHDAFNIGLVLSEYKHQFHVKFPTLKWPIKNAVTDMSYAIINAISHSWNKRKLIDYINLTYEAANGSIEWSSLNEYHGIETFIRICCGHITKNYSKDVAEHYPNMNSEHQTLLKEIFAGMFDITDLQKLKMIWMHFSLILLSRYSDGNVRSSLTELAAVITSAKKRIADDKDFESDNDTDEEDDYAVKNDNWKLPESDEHQAIYKASRFYQDFKTVTFDKEFEEADSDVAKVVNPYYSPKFCNMFLQKYISILSLWTCSSRFANSPEESNFKNTKKDAISDAVEIGSMPLKCGRFARFLKKRVCRITRSILIGAPRYRCTKNKRNQLCNDDAPPTKKLKLHVDARVLNVYKAVKQRNVRKNGSKAEIISSTRNADTQPLPTKVSNIPPPIDDPSVKESWGRTPKRKFTYFNVATLHKVTENPKHLTNILQQSKQLPQKHGKKKMVNKRNKLPNDLIDHPATYLAPATDFVIASTGDLNLSQAMYKELLPDTKLSNHLISYILSIFAKEYKSNSVQFEVYKTATMITFSERPILKIKKDILLGVYLDESIHHFLLVIVNCLTCTFSVVDPLHSNDTSGQYFENFLHFVDKHNESLKSSNIPNRDKWIVKSYDHQTQTDGINCGVFVLQFIKQYLRTGKINGFFNALEHRKELQHLILRKSIKMTGRCVVCGCGKIPDKITEWVKCDFCTRWTHIVCAETDENNLFDESIHFFCIICSANTTRSDLRSMSEDNIEKFEKFSQVIGVEHDTLKVENIEDEDATSQIDIIGVENDPSENDQIKAPKCRPL